MLRAVLGILHLENRVSAVRVGPGPRGAREEWDGDTVDSVVVTKGCGQLAQA